ncbi:MAG: hypothetical protein L0212_00880, partial [Acidobacteria bacterium]|nr:hypothetical protein [Acidobacteriota bacterium]
MNVGIQRELKPGLVVSVDYVRNVSLRYLLFADSNLVGDSRFLNLVAAQNAIAATVADCGVASLAAVVTLAANAAPCPDTTFRGGPTSMTPDVPGIEDFADRGLGSGKSLLGGESVLVAAGVSPDFGPAFAGINPEVGSNDLLSPVGRSVYNALQVSLRGKLSKPLPLVNSINLQSSYSLSRFMTQAANADVGDQDFINAALNAREQGRFFGPGSFDRTHQFSVGAVFEFPKFVRMSLITHHRSPLASTLFLEDGGRSGEIFHTDLDGDATVGDPLSGTDIGEFRSSGLSGLVDLVSAHNSNVAGTFTPAGQALIDNGLFSAAQLTALGAVVDSVPTPSANSIGLDWLHTLDAKLSFPIKLGEKFTIEPSVGVYNLFNFANFDTSPSVRLTGLLDGSEGSLGYTTLPEVRDGVRASQSSGVFSLGAARQAEFGLRITW